MLIGRPASSSCLPLESAVTSDLSSTGAAHSRLGRPRASSSASSAARGVRPGEGVASGPRAILPGGPATADADVDRHPVLQPHADAPHPPSRGAPQSVIDPSARIHPTADLEPGVSVGPRTSVWNRAQIRRDARLGADCIVGRDAFIDEGVAIGDRVKIQNGALVYHGVTVGSGVFIGPGAILTNDRYPLAITSTGELARAADWEVVPITLDDGCSIGAGAGLGARVPIGPEPPGGAGAGV